MKSPYTPPTGSAPGLAPAAETLPLPAEAVRGCLCDACKAVRAAAFLARYAKRP